VNTDFDAICWDNDGLLIDSERMFYELTRDVLAKYGVQLSPELWGMDYLGKGLTTVLIAQSLGLTEKQANAAMQERNEAYRVRVQQPPPLRPYASEVLHKLHGKLPMAMVTGSSMKSVRLMHRDSGLLPLFDHIVTQDDYERPKPAPDSYREALRRLGIHPSRCLAVEDSERGLGAAIAAGMQCAVVPNELTQSHNFSAALAVIETLSSIPELLAITDRFGPL
jgi:HAD superfamily hydrolase (TIGR01509 family)